ncbi:aspartyl-phosphate phosphatase Spo0E family protein [Neobacillus niacini]|uniref:aspartyl-phosphate phosphatase Spo0E family protein n=1 Tax=Neobacillus niacini TaxID=86668 RepID=UPI00052FBE7C|nr:aspartyl-phosphate phosphatase Spo0E family protein [Neobacillus niacini]KGM45499.1 hypothetical protein NP83_05645 [Neobacillus niacini]MEC1522497.1 aspartyl-phosphate phosphatase Spo0E family protein [Neobacillus niacini]
MNHLSMQKQIMLKRKELVSLTAKNGLKDSTVLKCSQELDLLIYQVQAIDMGLISSEILSCQNEWNGE